MTAPTVDTWAVVARAQSGDADALSSLWREHNQRVLRFIQYRTGDRHLSEDLASDVWVRALGGIGRIEYQGRDFGAWLTTIARNIVNDHFKSARVRLSTPVEDMHTWDLPAVDDPEAEAVAEVQRAAAERLLTEAMANLTPGQKRVIELRFFEDRSTTETAEALGRDLTASKVLQSRAVQSLRRQLTEVSA